MSDISLAPRRTTRQERGIALLFYFYDARDIETKWTVTISDQRLNKHRTDQSGQDENQRPSEPS